MGENQFKFAERSEQVKKVNTFLCISTAIVYLLSFIIVIVSCVVNRFISSEDTLCNDYTLHLP